MAKIGYIYKAEADDTYASSIEWMQEYGCHRIFEELPKNERTRVEWKTMLNKLGRGDELVLSKFSNAIRKTHELSALVEICRIKKVRLISIGDKIDSDDKLWPKTTGGMVLAMIGSLPADAMAVRQQASHIEMLKKSAVAKQAKVISKPDREQRIVNMYVEGHTIDDIWAVSGFSSRSSIFRILNKFGVDLNRGRTKGPRKPKNAPGEDATTDE